MATYYHKLITELQINNYASSQKIKVNVLIIIVRYNLIYLSIIFVMFSPFLPKKSYLMFSENSVEFASNYPNNTK